MYAIRVDIETTNDAFAESPEREVARILERAATLVRQRGTAVIDGTPLMDANGNHVGVIATFPAH